jgi:predicted NBD/HSP70 family sugar kinase
VLLGLLKEGDARALSAVERAGFCLGLALASSARIVPFTLVVLGGHLAVLDPWLRISLMDSLQRYSAGRFPPGNVLVSALGSTGALLGAAGLVIRSVLEAPHALLR